MVLKRRLKIDWWLLFAVLMVMGISVLAIFSTGISATGSRDSWQFLKQLSWIVLGFILMIILSLIDYQLLRHLALPLFVATLLILAALIFFGDQRNGTRAWLGLNIFGLDLGIQPSEFAKIAYIIFLATFLVNYVDRSMPVLFFAISLFLTLIPVTFVILQGDLGTAMVFFPIYFFMALVGGVSWRYLLYIFLLGVGFVALLILLVWAPHSGGWVWQLTRLFASAQLFLLLIATLIAILLLALAAWLVGNLAQFKVAVYLLSIIIIVLLAARFVDLLLRDYMRNRLLSLIAPELNPLSSGWNVIQSVRAIGSGGLSGTGFMQGILARYGYLPEQSQSTDFLFAVLGEEFGFSGCLVLFLSFALLLWRLSFIALSAPDNFSCLLSTGMIGLFFFHFIQNVGMNLGIMPVMGIPLPLFSYGGSSVLSSLMALGIIFNISAARY